MTHVLIDGVWQDRESRLDVHNPATGQVAGSVAFPSAADAARDAVRAADAAARAFETWSASTARYRADLLLTAAALITERSGELARLLAAEAGKRFPEAAGEIAFSAEYFRWFAEEARRADGAIVPHEGPFRRHLVFHRPAGVAERLDVGVLGVNDALPSTVFSPMGGVKQSGLGREGAALGLAEFTEPRYVSLGLT